MRQKHPSLKPIVFSILALVTALGWCALTAHAEDNDDNFVYVMSNKKTSQFNYPIQTSERRFTGPNPRSGDRRQRHRCYWSRSSRFRRIRWC